MSINNPSFMTFTEMLIMIGSIAHLDYYIDSNQQSMTANLTQHYPSSSNVNYGPKLHFYFKILSCKMLPAPESAIPRSCGH